MGKGGEPDGWSGVAKRRAERKTASRHLPISSILDALKTPDAFRHWLVQKGPDTVVGDYYTPDDSPVANYIWDVLGVYVWTADTIFDGMHFIEMPKWCLEFTRAEARRIESRTGGKTLWTASEALSTLSEVTKGE